ncbi:MATE family efflux transporter [Pseudodesulfovibrio sp. F-1]|uniref:Multidrug-efflux transporter n=1 Tax=Pseudodesulfovibrio alkaliphilus TaxID=2661613 RepID=A0A7K1KSE7_9BACT|nr:MATE family efflux transporter [Pseudodesulfovibrio alkaliphilus]MUM78880.1 MATE family efflux transporter [Pseudodesulfovibrio alkaliphilus]
MRILKTFRTELSKFLPLFGPLLVSQYAQTANGIIDTIMAARLGPEGLGSVAVGVALWMPVYMFVIGVLFGVLIIVAQHFGAKDAESIQNSAWQGIWTGLGLGIATAALVYAVSSQMGWFGSDPGLADNARGYVRMVIIGFPFGATAVALRFYSEGQEAVLPVTVMAVLVVGFNTFFNYVLMFGNFGFPAMGAQGCGLATSLSMVLFLIMLAVYTSFSPRFKNVRLLKSIKLPNPASLKAIFKLGLPIGFGVTSEYLVLSVITLFIGSVGALQVSAHQVAFSCMMLFFTIPASMSFAASIRVGVLMGAGDPGALRRSVNSILSLCAITGIVLGFIMFFQAKSLAVLMADQSGIATLAAGLIKIAALFLFSDAIQICCNGILRGVGDTAKPFAITASVYWLFCMPFGYILSGMPLPFGLSIPSGLFGIHGWWISLTISISLVAILLYHRVRKTLQDKEIVYNEAYSGV